MPNNAPCPNCAKTIDATAAAEARACPECGLSFSELVRIAGPDAPEPDSSDHYAYE